MTNPESCEQVVPEPTEAEVARSSTVLYEFMQAGWVTPMNPEDLDLIAYAVLKFRGEPGDLNTAEDSPQQWESIQQGTKDLIAEHRAEHQALIEAQARTADETRSKNPK